MSRTYVFAKRGASTSQTSYEIRGSDLRLLKSPSVGLTGKRSTGPFSYAVSPRLALICMPRDFPLFKSGSLWVAGYKTLWSEAWCISRWYIVPQTIFVQMDVQVMTWLQKEATTPPPSVNLYPKGGNPGKKVENPVAAIRKSLPKGRKTREKGRETRNRRPEISTQNAENAGVLTK